MKIAMLTMEKFDNRRRDSIGSSRIRARWVMKYCPEIVEFKNGFAYDAVIYQKAYYKEHMEAFTGVKIFDICDPDWLDDRPIVELSEMIDAFTVTTEKMRDFISKLTDKPAIIIPDRIDPEEHTPVKEIHEGKARSAVWFGYSSNLVVLDQIVDFLQGQNISLTVISDRNYTPADANVSYDYRSINDDIIKHDFVILPDYSNDLRHSFKSNNKTLTSWALKMPVAVNPEDVFRFSDPNERNKEAEEKYKYVMEECHVKLSGPQYVDLIKKIAKDKKEVR